MTKTGAGVQLRARLDADLPEGAEWTAAEVAMLELASAQADQVAALEAVIADQGYTVVGSMGQPRVNSVVSALDRSRSTLARILAQIDAAALGAPEQSPKQQRAVATARKAASTRWNRSAS